MSNNTFQSSFTTIFQQEWKDKLAKDLKTEDFSSLTKVDRNGIHIEPFYTHTASNTNIDIDHADWYIMEDIIVTDEKSDNARALFLLNNGVSGLHFIINQEVNWNDLLHSIDLQYIHIAIQCNNNDCINSLNEYIKTNYKDQNISVQIISPKSSLINNNVLSINAAIYNNAGSNAINEIGAIISQLNAALHPLRQDELQSLVSIQVNVAIDTNYFEQIAKLRALRNNIQLIQEAYDIHIPVFISAETSSIYTTTLDIYNNILRNTIAGMAAVIGGVNSLLIKNFNDNNQEEFSSRVSRNQQLLFKEESYLNAVIDISKGSYFIEQYSDSIAKLSWTIFQDIENKGGWESQLDEIKNIISNDAQKLISTYKSGERILIGVNKYQVKCEIYNNNYTTFTQHSIDSINIEHELLK